MSFSYRSVLIGAALLAFAPGCGVAVERTDGDPSSDRTPPGEADDQGEDDAAADDLAESGDDAADLLDRPSSSAPSSLCPSSSFSGTAAEAIAVSFDEDFVDLVMRDGALVALALPAQTPPEGAFPSMTVVSGDDRVVVTRGWTTDFGPGGTVHATTRWFDRTGALLEELVSEDGLWATHLLPGGATVLYRNTGVPGYVVRFADGALQDIPDFDIWGAPLGSGWLQGYDTSQERVALVNPISLERLLLDLSATYPALVDDGYVYLAGGSAAPSLVHFSPEGTVSTPLPELAGANLEHLGLTPVAGSRWVLVTDWITGAEWRIDRASGDVVTVSTTPPEGSELLTDTCGLAFPTLTSSGQVLAGLRTSGDGQAAVADVAGGDWQPLGLPFAQPGVFRVHELAGTFILSSGEGTDSYCPIVGWDAPASAEAVGTDAVQIVRPSADVARVLHDVHAWSITASADGGCVTFTSGEFGAFENEGPPRTIVDVAGGEALELDGDSLLWIE